MIIMESIRMELFCTTTIKRLEEILSLLRPDVFFFYIFDLSEDEQEFRLVSRLLTNKPRY